MLFGCIFCFLVMIGRILFENDYKQIVRGHFTSGFLPILYVGIGGLFNLGLPHILIAIAQQWIPSAAVQLAKPLIPAASAIFGEFLPINEKFTRNKLYALICAIIGVTLSAIPSFLHTNKNASFGNVLFGYFLLILSMAILGFAAVYFRWKTPNVDITISSFIQTGFSFIFDLVFTLYANGYNKTKDNILTVSLYGWLWPILLGVVASGIAVHGFMYLVEQLGAVGSGFIPFGQILVGVGLGVLVLNEWNGYKFFEITLQIIGILFLSSAIAIGFIKEEELNDVKKIDEEEDKFEESSNSLAEI